LIREIDGLTQAIARRAKRLRRRIEVVLLRSRRAAELEPV
jgi:hypothetical protein